MDEDHEPGYIWITRWEDFQTFQRKRGKPWAPPWIKTYLAQLHDDRYLALTDRQRALLHDLRCIFAVTLGRVPRDSAAVTHHRHRQTFRSDLDALNHAGLIQYCSGTELERRRALFWNRSVTEVEVEVEVEVDKEPSVQPLARPPENGRTEEQIFDYKNILKEMPL